MRAVVWIPILFALAAALAIAANYSSGYVLMVVPPYRVELSLNLLIMLLIAFFFLLYWLVRFSATAIALPTKVREYRLRRRRDKARQVMLNALTTFFEGRYAKAERAAVKALRLKETPALAAAVAARSAHELKAFDRRDRYLSEVEALDGEHRTVPLVTRAQLLLEERRAQEALTTLGQMDSKHTMALKLELKAHQQAKNWNEVLALTHQLEKRGAVDPVQGWQVKRHAHIQNVQDACGNREELRAYWQKIARQDKRDPRIAAEAARCFAALGEFNTAREIIEQALDAEWDQELVLLYSDSSGDDTLARIERAEKWLQLTHPDDAALLLTLGRLCARQGLWGKAESYLDASLSLEPSYTAHMVLAKLHETEDPEKARAHYEKSLELALMQLKSATGGRRRSAI